MAVFGNLVTEQSESISMDSFMNFLEEATLEVNSIFERASMIEIIREGNELAIPNNVMDQYSFDSEKVKKTIVEKAKEIWKKFCDAVKTAFENLSKKLTEMYLNTNFEDKILSKFKDKVTYDNLKKCKDAGWAGVPTSCPQVQKIASPMDSRMYRDLTDDDTINISKDIDPILNCGDLDKAKEIYKDFKEKLSKFSEESDRETSGLYMYSNNIDILGQKDPREFFFTVSTDRPVDDNHYFPTAEAFSKTKQLAENGQKMIKDYRMQGKASIKLLKGNQDLEMNNLKNFKGANKEEKSEENQIKILYYRARYGFTVAYIKRSQKVLSAVIGVLQKQHNVAIKSYMYYTSAIARYKVA